MSCSFHTIIIHTFLYTKIQIFLFFLQQREFARAILKGIYPCLYACKFMCSCVRSTMCACFVSIWGMGTSSLLCKHKRDIWCDTTRSSFYFSAHSMLLFCYRAAAFVVSDFRGPRPMSMRIHQRGSAIETKVLAN